MALLYAIFLVGWGVNYLYERSSLGAGFLDAVLASFLATVLYFLLITIFAALVAGVVSAFV